MGELPKSINRPLDYRDSKDVHGQPTNENGALGAPLVQVILRFLHSLLSPLQNDTVVMARRERHLQCQSDFARFTSDILIMTCQLFASRFAEVCSCKDGRKWICWTNELGGNTVAYRIRMRRSGNGDEDIWPYKNTSGNYPFSLRKLERAKTALDRKS